PRDRLEHGVRLERDGDEDAEAPDARDDAQPEDVLEDVRDEIEDVREVDERAHASGVSFAAAVARMTSAASSTSTSGACSPSAREASWKRTSPPRRTSSVPPC